MSGDPELRRQIDRPLTTLAVAFLAAIAAVPLYVVPITVGASVSGRGFSEKQVGDAFGLAGLVYVVIVASSPLWITRWNWRWTSGLAIIFSAASAIGLTQTSSYPFYILFQAVQTACLALLFPPIMCALGASSEPERKYGIVLLIQCLLGAGMVFFLKASVLPKWDYEGVYGVLAVYTLFGLAVVGLIPSGGDFNQPKPSKKSGWLRRERLTLLGLTALAFYCVSMNGFISFSERYGEHYGFSGSLIASALAIGILLSAVGSAFVAVVGNRWGRVKPLLASMGIALAGFVLLMVERNPAYFVAVCLISLSFRVILAFAYATVAAADTSGRFTGVMTAAAGVGIAISVAMMGRIITSYGYPTFAVTLMVITFLSVSLMASVAYQVQLRDEDA